MRFETVEYGYHGARDCTAPHSTYLRALLYLINRANKHMAGKARSEVFQLDEPNSRTLVKMYSGGRFPTAEDVISAVKHPERFRVIGENVDVRL